MNLEHLKILLKLLGKNNYQGKINEIKPQSKTSINLTQKLCYELHSQKLISIEEKNISIKITNQGIELLDKINCLDNLEQKILKQCQNENLKISKIKITPARKRDLIIHKLEEKQLITIIEKKIHSVELKEKAQQFLAEEYLTEGLGNISLTKSLLNIYLTFIRNYFNRKNQEKISLPQDITTEVKKENPNKNKPITADDILQTIIKLDQQLNTDNYLPIFHLRNKYKSVLPRQELDNMIFALQKDNKISLSRLVDASQYTPEEYDAGIPQSIGYPIFYLIVK